MFSKQSRIDRRIEGERKLDRAALDLMPEATSLMTRLGQQLSFQNWTGATDTVALMKKNPLANQQLKKLLKENKNTRRQLARLGVI